uniref:Uncharacterized protein n=1 Tax=Seriola lalandi dorsalis TaxID=1841481 RepID=A0A3B4YHF0_SERLL
MIASLTLQHTFWFFFVLFSAFVSCHSNNRIPPEGAIRLTMGLRVNKTIKSLNMGRNPILSAGCYGILKSIQENPDSAMEALNFAGIPVNQDFEDLYTKVKEIFPALTINHGGRIGTFRKAKA